MSSVRLSGNASGTGIFTIASPNSNTDRTLTLPNNSGTLVTNATAGTVLQVVNGTYASSTSTTSTSFVDTGLSASITPTSATSKILVFVSLTSFYKSGNNNLLAVCQLVRNSTAINIFETIGPYNNSASDTNRESNSTSTTYLDSPATTSSTTYKVQFRVDGAGTIASQGNGGNSTITLMEIAA